MRKFVRALGVSSFVVVSLLTATAAATAAVPGGVTAVRADGSIAWD
ncbi:hypothetical protein ACFV6F_20700 [Kitasatospora phosalacinea]